MIPYNIGVIKKMVRCKDNFLMPHNLRKKLVHIIFDFPDFISS